MNLKTTTRVKILDPEQMKYFDYFHLSVVDEGLLIEAKSPLFCAWAKKLSKGETFKGEDLWRNATFYGPIQDRNITGTNQWFCSTIDSLFDEGRANMVWIFDTSLGDGMKLLLPTAISPNNFLDYFLQCVEHIQAFYTSFMRKMTAKATFREIWREEEEDDVAF